MSLRASSYTIYIPMPQFEDKVLLVHGFTGAVDLVARETAAYLKSKQTNAHDKPLHGEWGEEASLGPSPAVAPSDETLGVLETRGYLTRRSKDEEHALVAKGATLLQRQSCASSFQYVIMPTYQCNLRCAYCFQDHMRTDPRFAHLLTRMTPATADRIFAAIPALERQVGATEQPSRNLTLFGGEPLLAENLEVVRHIVGLARAAGITAISAVTNGTELDAYADLLGRDGIPELQITLDGPPEDHDRRRVHADGSGSFAAIADNIDLALARGAAIAVRVNVDRSNAPRLPQLARTLVERGWSSHPQFLAYTAVVYAANANTPTASTFDSGELVATMNDLRALFPEMAALQRPSDGLRRNFMKVFEGRKQPHSLFRASYCGAHAGMYVFDAFGDIYKCWDKTGDTSLRVGTVRADGTLALRGMATAASAPAPALRRTLPVVTAAPNDIAGWQSRTIASNSACSRCRFAFFCGGGCGAQAADHKGSYYTNVCDGFQTNFRRAVGEAYAAHAAGERGGLDVGRLCGA